MSNDAKAKLQTFWKNKAYLIIDEFSMISKLFLALLSRNISIAKEGSPNYEGISFGGISVILSGDLHQFPPVAASRREYLYTPNELASDSLDCQIGRSIYEEFKTVVILKEQKRITDPIWHNMLTNLRQGLMREDDVKMLRSLVISPSQKDKYDAEPWTGASLVTPRHAVRTMWNKYAVRKLCAITGEQLFICHTEDRIGQRPLTLKERYQVALRNKRKRRKKSQLPDEVELARGMKVLVTNNIATDLDITNGACHGSQGPWLEVSFSSQLKDAQASSCGG
jgi:PIF1-like helicase